MERSGAGGSGGSGELRSFVPPNFCVRRAQNHLVPWLYSFLDVSFILFCKYFLHNITVSSLLTCPFA